VHRVFLVDQIEARAEARLAASAEVVRCDAPLHLADVISDVDGVIVRTSPLTADVLSRASRLRVIGKHGVGLDNIDVGFAAERGIAVVHTPAANAPAVAEFALACILLLQRPIIAAQQALRDGRYTPETSFVEQNAGLSLIGREVAGQTVGIVGWGAIGRRVGAAVLSLGAQVLVYDPLVSSNDVLAAHATPVHELDDLLASADIVTLHVPSTPQTIGLIGARELGVMRPHAVLVNSSRGAVVDEAALTAALEARTIRAAALDVFAHEPPPADHPLLAFDNVICTPHLGGATEESLARMAEDVVDGVLAALA
jgi:phosphoglycerate dehydrogenase-like enzyme